MAGILGYRFHSGPEIPRPAHDPSLPWATCTDLRAQWADAIREAVREHDAWALLCTAPNGDITLRDILTDGSTWAATGSHSVRLLLAQEA